MRTNWLYLPPQSARPGDAVRMASTQTMGKKHTPPRRLFGKAAGQGEWVPLGFHVLAEGGCARGERAGDLCPRHARHPGVAHLMATADTVRAAK